MSARVIQSGQTRWVEDSRTGDSWKLVVCECGQERAEDHEGPCNTQCERGRDEQ